jgi:putative membrane protein
MHKGVIFSLILSVLLVIFALQNTEAVSLNLWFWSIHTSLALLVIVLLVLGAVIGYLLLLPAVFRKDKLLREKSNELKNVKRGTGHQSGEKNI